MLRRYLSSNVTSGTAKFVLRAILLTVILSAFVIFFTQGPGNEVETEEEFSFSVDCDKVYSGEINAAEVDVVRYQTPVEVFERVFRTPFNCLPQDEEHVVEYVSKSVIQNWDETRPTNLSTKRIISDHLMEESNQAFDVWSMIFKDKITNGFFIEAGAADCEWGSVTLPFELKLNWTGLLVEMSREFYERCKIANRRAKLANTCLAIQPNMHFAHFDESSAGQIKTELADKEFFLMPGLIKKKQAKNKAVTEVQCIPLYTMLLAMGNPTVHLFVLDVEGAELQILQTIPFDKVDIQVLSVETNLAGTIMPGSRDDILNLMRENGYKRFYHNGDYSEKTKTNANDLFVRNDIVKKYNVRQLKVDIEYYTDNI